MINKFSLMIHGGAGIVFDKELYSKSLRQILEKGREMLSAGKSSLDVVEYCVTKLEDDPLFNAGKGSVLNEKGLVDLDAAIMDGRDLSAGSVAGVKNIKNPIQLARRVMEKTSHVMLIGEGAVEFAQAEGMEMAPDNYFITEKRVNQLKEAQEKGRIVLDHSDSKTTDKKFGTVGAVAMDIYGNLAAATSTGGLVNKKFGRVGDTPIIGAGVFADNETCAVSATGIGEKFIRTVLSKDISNAIRYQKLNAEEAAKFGIEYLVNRVGGEGGVIVIDYNGNCGHAFSTPAMVFGSLNKEGEIKCDI